MRYGKDIVERYATAETMILHEASILNEAQMMGDRAKRGEHVWASDVSAMLDRYSTTFDELPGYLRQAIDEIDLAD